MNPSIRNTVNSLIKKYSTRDPFQLMDYLEIELIESPLGQLLGRYMPILDVKCIFLNSNIKDPYMRLIVASHELGHAVMHSTLNCSFMKNKTLKSSNSFEMEANAFAAELLIDDIDYHTYCNCTIQQIATMKHTIPELLILKI